MRILFTSIAGTGHFNPLIPYAQEMQRRGHEVRVASPDIMASQIAAAGLAHIVVGRPTDAERDAFFSQFAHLPPLERNPVMGGGLFADLLPKKALPKLQACVDAWRPNLIVREAGEYAAVIVSALTGTPHVRVSVSNGHTFKTTVGPTDALRQEYGLKPDHGMSLRGARAFSNFPAAMEVPNGDGALVPQFRVSTHMTAPATGKADWVFRGERPRIYLTFGTVMGSSPEAKQVFRAALDAVGGMEVQVLMTTGPAMDVNALGPIPDNVTLRDFVPQHDVFPHVDAVMCHGGSGTVIGALAAGLPLVVTPIGADQPENARAVDALGAGIAVIKPDAVAMSAALRQVLVDPRWREVARNVSAEIAAQPGIEAAVDEMLTHARHSDQ